MIRQNHLALRTNLWYANGKGSAFLPFPQTHIKEKCRIFTTVYLIQDGEGYIIFDTASSSEDVENYILPAMQELGISGQAVKYAFISHNHGDHALGVPRLLQEYPHICLVTSNAKLAAANEQHTVLMPKDGDMLTENFRVISIPGHTRDSQALLDLRTNTLITGDCLQMHGIFGSGKWGANIGYPVEHLEAVKKVSGMDIDLVITAHNYEPYGFMAAGKENVAASLNACAEPLMKLKDMILANPQMDDEQIVSAYNNAGKVPTIGAHVAKGIRAAIADGKI